MTELALDIMDTSDRRFMRIMDLSCYNPKITTHAERLSVIAPGSYSEVFYPVTAGFNEIVTTKTLMNHEIVGFLPDGVYYIKYSIAPNDKLWVEYAHLRTTSILQRYYNALCSVQVDCFLDKDKDEKLEALRRVRMLIEAAKSYVEYCDAVERGNKIYKYAEDSLARIEASLGNCKKCDT